jgi:hypothetical protein
MNEPACKGCRESVEATPEAIRRFIDKIERSGRIPLSSAEDYERRLAACRRCEALQFGTTCRYCGCFVEVRARLAESGCPYPYAPKWTPT